LSRGRPRGSFWPSATQRALLEVGLGPEAQASERWRALQPLDVTTLETGSFGLLPPLYERLQEVAPEDPQLPRLFGTYRSVWYRNQLLLERLAVLLPLLRERARVRPLLVGGMSALLRWYPRLGLRPVPLLELIVEREVAGDAVQVSTYAGWRPSSEARFSTTLRDESERVLVIHHGAPPAVLGPLGAADGTHALRGRAVELDEADGTPLVLDPADELLFICATGARTVPVQTCQWLVDAYRLLQSSEAPDPKALLELARRAHLVAHVRATLHYLAELTADHRLSGYVSAFDAEPVQRRDRVAFALAGVGGSRLAGTAQMLGAYAQATADEPPLRAVTGLPRHLQERWGADSLAGVPVLAVKKALRLGSPQARPPAPDRNRSASS
jgi:Uncharacterised nucleotidyltransferase